MLEVSSSFTRVRSIAVVGLFGIFTHEIALNLDRRLTVVHGPNGLGKTMLLRMLHELLTVEPDALTTVPFTELSISFVNGRALRVSQRRDDRADCVGLPCTLTSQDGTPESFDLLDLGKINRRLAIRVADHLPGRWRYLQNAGWQDMLGGEVLTTTAVLRRYQTRIPKDLRTELKPNRLLGIVNSRFVRSERLETGDKRGAVDSRYTDTGRRREQPPRATVKLYAEDLQERIQTARTEYGSVSARLDSSFVTRLLSDKSLHQLSAEQITKNLNALDSKRRTLGELGLLNLEQGPQADVGLPSSVAAMLADKLDLFSLYLHDMEEKVKVFDTLQAKLEVLRTIINRRFSYKQLKIDEHRGFVFISTSETELTPQMLSSGEQHLLVLLYELLFFAESGDLVIIDEPEISLHVEWQMQFLSDMREAQTVSGIDILIATHSPTIAGGAADSLVSLTGPETHAQGKDI